MVVDASLAKVPALSAQSAAWQGPLLRCPALTSIAASSRQIRYRARAMPARIYQSREHSHLDCGPAGWPRLTAITLGALSPDLSALSIIAGGRRATAHNGLSALSHCGKTLVLQR